MGFFSTSCQVCQMTYMKIEPARISFKESTASSKMAGQNLILSGKKLHIILHLLKIPNRTMSGENEGSSYKI